MHLPIGDPLARDRLHRAVRRTHTLSRKGLLELMFACLFKGLVYPQIWEDPEIDIEALAIVPNSHVVAIASGGCNILSYLITNSARITAVDLNTGNVTLNRLKVAAPAPSRRWVSDISRLPLGNDYFRQSSIFQVQVKPSHAFSVDAARSAGTNRR